MQFSQSEVRITVSKDRQEKWDSMEGQRQEELQTHSEDYTRARVLLARTWTKASDTAADTSTSTN